MLSVYFCSAIYFWFFKNQRVWMPGIHESLVGSCTGLAAIRLAHSSSFQHVHWCQRWRMPCSWIRPTTTKVLSRWEYSFQLEEPQRKLNLRCCYELRHIIYSTFLFFNGGRLFISHAVFVYLSCACLGLESYEAIISSCLISTFHLDLIYFDSIYFDLTISRTM